MYIHAQKKFLLSQISASKLILLFTLAEERRWCGEMATAHLQKQLRPDLVRVYSPLPYFLYSNKFTCLMNCEDVFSNF